MHDKLILIGAGENGLVVASSLKEKYKVIQFLDDKNENDQVVGKIGDYKKFVRDYDFFITIGSNAVRKNIFQELKKGGLSFINAIHETAKFESTVHLGENVFIGALTYININTIIGDNVFINNKCIVEHDNVIGSHSHLTPGVITGGKVHIGNESFIGLGAVINDHLKLGDNVTIGSGAVVINDIPNNTTAVGVPAKIIKR